jgi:hypothetical protein
MKPVLGMFTICQDEPEFLSTWCENAFRQVDRPEHVYVLEHASESPSPIHAASIDGARRHGASIVRLEHNAAFDHIWLRDTVAAFHLFLLDTYQWVAFAETDEILAPSPGIDARLVDVVRSAQPDIEAYRAEGFDVVQTEHERSLTDIDPVRFLRDRRHWVPNSMYNKTLISRIPLMWSLGFHSLAEPVNSDDQTITLTHLKRIDFDMYCRRTRRAASRAWNVFDMENNLGAQNRLTDNVSLADYYTHDETGQLIINPPLIPTEYLEAFG